MPYWYVKKKKLNAIGIEIATVSCETSYNKMAPDVLLILDYRLFG